MKHLVIFSGAGISAESGIKTFRDSDGLWENYNIMEVATPEAFEKNPALVLDFYNQRRKNIYDVLPNKAHKTIAQLEKYFKVSVVTQNIDNLHELAGSSNVTHLHGEISKSRSAKNPSLIYNIEGTELNIGDRCELGSQLRPHIVWFGEEVPMMDKAAEIVSKADIFIIIGTSLNVYPAAGLSQIAPENCKTYLIDPKEVDSKNVANLTTIKETASVGMKMVWKELVK